MALITPQLLSTAAFDATQDHAFVFIVTGGDQVVASRLIVKNNVTLEEVYNQQIQSFNFEHPARSYADKRQLLSGDNHDL